MLGKPVISWLVRRDSSTDFKENDDFYAGTFNGSTISFEMEIWNNRHGTEKVEDLQDFSIEFAFDDLEDASLVNYTSFLIGATQVETPFLNGSVGVLRMPSTIILSGEPNDGTEDSTPNYVRVKMIIDIPEGKQIKMNDLKAMTFSISLL